MYFFAPTAYGMVPDGQAAFGRSAKPYRAGPHGLYVSIPGRALTPLV